MKPTQVFSSLDSKPPHPSANRHDRIAIVARVGPADASLSIWLKFHSLAGISDFYLYDNGAPEDALGQASSLAQKEKWQLTVFPWRFQASTDRIKKGTLSQLDNLLMAQCHAIANYGSGYRWFAFIDTSDLIVPKQQPTLASVLQSLSSVSNISLPRLEFPLAFDKTALTTTNRLPAAKPSHLVYRCLVDPCKVRRLHHGRFVTTDMGKRTANDQGLISSHGGPFGYRRSWSSFFSTKHIQLNHYRQAEAAGSEEDSCALDFLKRHGYSSAQEFTASYS